MGAAISAVQSEAILKELGRVWRELSHEQEQERQTAVLRACAMTLIVATEDSDDVATVGETLAALMVQHPARAIVLRFFESRHTVLEARVLAQCWMPFGSRQQICCEQIEITADYTSLREVPTAILGLVVPDLPVVLWCRQPELLHRPEFQQILPLVDKVIIDTDGKQVQSRLEQLRELRQAGRIIGDLAWTRLTAWREAVAEAFETAPLETRIRQIQSVAVMYGGAEPPAEARYLAAWFRVILGEHASVELSLRPDVAGLQSVTVSAGDITLEVSRPAQGSEEVKMGAHQRRTVPSDPGEYELLRVELSILGRDPIFDQMLAAAVAQEPSKEPRS